MDGSSSHCLGERKQDYRQEKEMPKSKIAFREGLTNSCGKKRCEKQRRKRKIYPFQCKEIEKYNRMGKTQFSPVQSLSCVRLFATSWSTALQASLSITNSQSPPKPVSIETVMPSDISSSVIPLSFCLKSFPASGSFQMSPLFPSGGQSRDLFWRDL